MKAKVLSVIRTLCCQDLLKEEVDSFSCSITKESLYETYYEVMISNSQRNEGDNRAMDLFLARRDIFDLIFEEFVINEQFVFRAETVVKEGARKKLFSADSEWLTSSDIKALKKYEKERQGSGQKKIKCLFFSSLHSSRRNGPISRAPSKKSNRIKMYRNHSRMYH